jgi:hypothetical protein
MTRIARLWSRLALGLTTTVLLTALAAPASALPVLDFMIGPPHPATANISYAGGVAPLVGIDINVVSVTGVDTSSNNGVTRTCFGCVLSFTTGNFSSSNAIQWIFGGVGHAGTILLTGGVDLNGNNVQDGGDIAAGSTLLSGDFSGPVSVTFIGGTFRIAATSNISDEKHVDLLDFYGLPNIPFFGNLNLGFNAPGLPPDAFDSISVGSGDVENMPTPEPGTLLLLGSGLLGLGYLQRRRHRS